MTYLELCQSTRAQAGISGEGPSSVDNQIGIYADIARWVSESYNEIQTMFENWNFLHNTYEFVLQGGQDKYNPSQLVGNMGGVGVRTPTLDTFMVDKSSNIQVNEKRLGYIPWSVWQIDNRVLDGKTGRPKYYTEDPAGNYHFYPSEEYNPDPLLNIDHIINFQGYSRPASLKENTDVPLTNPQYDEIIILGALIRYAEYYNSQEVAQSARQRYMTQLVQLKYSELPRNNLATPTFVAFA